MHDRCGPTQSNLLVGFTPFFLLFIIMNNDILRGKRGWPSPPPSLDDWTQSKKGGDGDWTIHKQRTVQQAILWKRKFTSLGTKLKSQQESELKVKANLISDRKGARKHGGSE